MEISLDGLLPFLADKAAPLCHAVFDVDSCIASTNVAAHVCEYFGIGAFPQQVRVRVYNPRAVEKMRDNDARFDGTDGAYALLIAGTGTFGEGRWDGHLVTVVPFVDDLFVLDMTVAQFSRPQWNITVPPALVLRLDERWDSHDESTYSAHQGPSGTVLSYSPMVADQSGFRNAADWVDPNGIVRTLAGVIVAGYRRWVQGEDIKFVVNGRGKTCTTVRPDGRLCDRPYDHQGEHEFVTNARLALPAIEIVSKGQRAVRVA